MSEIMSKGFMRVSRERMSEWRWLQNQTKFYVFFRLLLKANYKDMPFEKTTVKRGQLMFSYDKLAAELGVSLQTLRTTLKDLQNTNDINIQSTRQSSLLTICDYDSWQEEENQANTQSTYEQHTSNTQPTLSKEIKEINKEKEEDTNVSKKKEPVTELEKEFEAFRRKYKEYGGSARGFETEFENFKKKNKDWKDVIPMLMYCLNTENEARTQAQRYGEFFPQMKNLQTYLNQRSWEAYSEGWESYDPDAYHPDGFPYDAEFDAYRFCDYIPNYDLLDGYNDDNRPDGARIVDQINVWVWSKEQRQWNRA